MGVLEKIAEIEKEISRTQKNKGDRNYSMLSITKDSDTVIKLLVIIICVDLPIFGHAKFSICRAYLIIGTNNKGHNLPDKPRVKGVNTQ